MDNSEKKISVTMTIEQWCEVYSCVLQEQKQYERNREAWARLSLEKNPDGTPTYKNAKRNVECLDMKISELKELRRVLNGEVGKREEDI